MAWSPISKQHLDDGMSLQALAAAAIRYSDNAAMNLILREIGGLPAVNRFARSIGDQAFRQDNDWPAEAGSGGAGNVFDSTTPEAMVTSMHTILFGDRLPNHQWLPEV